MRLTLLTVSARACVCACVRTSVVGIGSSRTRLRNYACRRSAVTGLDRGFRNNYRLCFTIISAGCAETCSGLWESMTSLCISGSNYINVSEMYYR